MNPIKLMRKLIGILRGGAAPAEVFLAVLLGVLAGFVTGLNLTFVFLLVVLLVLNANVAVFLFFFLIGKLISIPVAPLSFKLGKALLAIPGVETVVRKFVNAPVAALMGLERYVLLGGIILGVVLGVIAALIVARAVTTFRRRMASLEEGSQAFKKLSGNFFVRLVMRILLGKRRAGRKLYGELLEARARIFRKSGIALAAACVVIVLVVTVFLDDYALRRGLEAGLTSANGATVDVESASISLLTGRLSVGGLQFTDPDKLDRNRLEISRLTADVGVPDLLRRRIVIDEALLSGVRSDTQRSQPGTRVEKPAVEAPPEEKPPTLPEIKDLPVQDIFKQGKEIQRRLLQLRDVLIKLKALARRTDKGPREPTEQEIAARHLGQFRAEYLFDEFPALTVRRLVIDDLPIPIEGKTHVIDVLVKGLSSNPAVASKNPSIQIGAEDAGLSAAVLLSLKDPSQAHRLELKAEHVDMTAFQKLLSEDFPVRFDQGQACVACEGTFSTDFLDLSLSARLTDLQIESAGGKGILGLDPQSSRALLDTLSSTDIALRIRGSLTSPVVSFDQKQLLQSLKTGLVEAGKQEITRRAKEELDKALKEKLGDELPGIDPGGLLEDLLGGKKGEQTKDSDEEKEEPEPKSGDIADTLKQIFR